MNQTESTINRNSDNIISENWDYIIDYFCEEFEITKASYNSFIKYLHFHSFHSDVCRIAIEKDDIDDYSDSKAVFFREHIRTKYLEQLKISIEAVTNIIISDLDIDYPSSFSNQTASKTENIEETYINSGSESLSFFDDKYTFDNFVVSSTSDFAHSASLAVAEDPGTVYNPLFIYGGVGLGKTHLMKAIGNYIHSNNYNNMKVVYCTSETFTNEFIEYVQNKKMADFRKKYRNIDVLLIDDIQFIGGKNQIQEEFFHTFNELFENKKQIVITSDKPPKELQTLEERLTSRFGKGLLVDIQSPSYETRMAILKKKCEDFHYTFIPDNVLDYIATNIQSNIRDLEGALLKLSAAYRFSREKEVTMEMAQHNLKDFISPNDKKVITIDYIINMVANYFNITQEDICSQKRNKNIVYPRQVCMYLSSVYTDGTQKEIGDKVGGRDHSTVINGIKKIKNSMGDDYTVQNDINTLVKMLNPDK